MSQINTIIKSKGNVNTPQNKMNIVNQLIPVLSEIKNSVIRDEYVRLVGEKLDVNEILKIKKILKTDTNFNILMFFDEFKDDIRIQNDIFTNINMFDNSQILKDY
jgi:DNA primase